MRNLVNTYISYTMRSMEPESYITHIDNYNILR